MTRSLLSEGGVTKKAIVDASVEMFKVVMQCSVRVVMH